MKVRPCPGTGSETDLLSQYQFYRSPEPTHTGFWIRNQNTQELKCFKSLRELFTRPPSTKASESSPAPSGGQRQTSLGAGHVS